MRLVHALVAECQLCSYFVQLHRIHYKIRTLNLQIKHRQCWFNNFESTCSLLNCRLQLSCPSCISLMFLQHPSKIFFVNVPQKYFLSTSLKNIFVDIPQKYFLSTSLKNIVCQHPSKIFFVDIPQKYFLSTSLKNIFFVNTPQKYFILQHPSTYFRQHPSQYLVAGRRPSNWWALHRQKPMQLKMR